MAPSGISTDIAAAIQVLNAGGCVGMPTETVYGLAADALNTKAVAQIFEIKQRPTFDPLIVHIPDWKSLSSIATEIPPLAQRLAERFWPGPLTLILPKKSVVPDLVTSGMSSVAVRIPSHPMALELLHQFGRPLAAPSANRFGRISPTTAAAVQEELGSHVPLILDGGPCTVGVESTIVRVTENGVELLRAGGTTVEAIESCVGPVTLLNQPKERPDAPGQLWHHYAPVKPLRIYPDEDSMYRNGNPDIGLIGWGPMKQSKFGVTLSLSETFDFVEAASRLFSVMRAMDAANIHSMAVCLLPEEGLGRAINERLRRAGIVEL